MIIVDITMPKSCNDCPMGWVTNVVAFCRAKTEPNDACENGEMWKDITPYGDASVCRPEWCPIKCDITKQLYCGFKKNQEDRQWIN